MNRPFATCLGVACAALLSYPARAQADTPPPVVQNLTGSPIRGCISLMNTNQPSGFYRVAIDGAEQAVFCENRLAHGGRTGGWTLVWSHLRSIRGNISTDLRWGEAIGSAMRIRHLPGASPAADLQLFEAFAGIRWWKAIINQDQPGSGEIAYQWAADFSVGRRIDRQAICAFDLDERANWTISINSANCAAPNGLPGFFTYSTGRPFSALDVDNDSHATTNCAAYYRNPWWHGDCWSGFIMGGGEHEVNYKNGAFWSSSVAAWGNAQNGTGAGNGWIFVR